MDCQADFIAKRSMLNDMIDLLNFKGESVFFKINTFTVSSLLPVSSGCFAYSSAAVDKLRIQLFSCNPAPKINLI